MSYLSKRGATYYFRRVIPDELQPVIGRREFMVSLRTKDKEEAKRLIPHHVIASDKRLQEARQALAAASVPKPKAYVPSRAEVEQEEAQAEHDAQAEAELEALEPIMEAIEAGTVPDAPAVDLVRAGQLLARHERQMAAIQLEEQANARIARYAPKAEAVENSQMPKAGAAPVLLAPGIFDQWKAEGNKRAKTIAMVEKTAEWFHARVGKLPVQDITKAHVLDFKNKLIAEGQSVANINVRLSHISLLLGWAARNAIVPDNVAKGTAIPDPQAKKKRRKPFDLAALKAIFGGPVHAKGDRPEGGKGEAAYWLPVLALYTGARVRELAQLRRSDVREMEYPDAEGEMHKGWFLNITEDEDDEGLANAIKNDGSERLVPVHPKLIELGSGPINRIPLASGM
ncbi:DUF6538 domain-containing protein [Sphingomonas fennica]|nr:DUF6538 domain-containing protein [Sphingomonas fennica]